MANRMNALDWIATVLVVIGAIVWGLVGVFNINVVEWLLGEATVLSRTVYILVGISGLYSMFRLAWINDNWK